MMIDATHNFNNPLTLERLYSWHAALFPTGYSGMYKIKVAALRDDKDGPMQVISNKGNREIIYYQAPDAKILPLYMQDFLKWIDTDNTMTLRYLKETNQLLRDQQSRTKKNKKQTYAP